MALLTDVQINTSWRDEEIKDALAPKNLKTLNKKQLLEEIERLNGVGTYWFTKSEEEKSLRLDVQADWQDASAEVRSRDLTIIKLKEKVKAFKLVLSTY